MFKLINILTILVLLTFSSEIADAAPPCQEVIVSITPCLSFIKGQPDPAPGCCSGAKGLAKQANTKLDRQGICECLKGVLPKIGPYDPKRFPLIAQKCGINTLIPPISATTDCTKV
ncbi:hypothetical protein ERO13_D08G044700v2 [Gossypium hirsutum]|uniref:Non-specific lipid-transfer protein n=2 Tax=Gossypium TaxID=3633 RepID=A0A1U8KNB1_GOSHI|nr:non-specific lipid-transfer protein-like [Gossypium hirsutum]KAG4132633.1 hypothetical protein ERO13_D08G044700v2 [Gossypium hirsutum]TYI67804.1 hypothetical protein E1A91_D08G043900v1 [Gossypium mustelinum]